MKSKLFLLLIPVVLVALYWVRSAPKQPKFDPIEEEATAPAEGMVADVPVMDSVPKAEDKPTTQPEPKQAPDIRELLRRGEKGKAIASLEEVLRNDPKNAFALLNLGKLMLHDETQRDKAEGLLKRAVESDPENREALEQFLSTQYDESKPGSRMQSLQKLVEENPDSPNIAGAYARSLSAKGQVTEAIAVMEKAIENPGADAFAFETLKNLYRKSGEPGKAAQAFERTVQKQTEMIADLKSKGQPTADVQRSLLRSQAFLAGELIKGNQVDRAEALIRAIEQTDPNHRSLAGLREELERARRG